MVRIFMSISISVKYSKKLGDKFELVTCFNKNIYFNPLNYTYFLNLNLLKKNYVIGLNLIVLEINFFLVYINI